MTLRTAEGYPPLARLQRQWLAITVGACAAVAALALGLAAAWAPIYAARWAALTTLTLAAVLAALWRALPLNHPPDDSTLAPTLGLPNTITVLRGVLLAGLAGFIFSPWAEGALAWAPGVLYTAAIVLDYLDGLAARLSGRVSELGAALDTELDGLGVAAALGLVVWYGQLPLWMLTVGAARYLFVVGVWWRRRRGLPVYELPESDVRRPLAGFEMGLISAVLWPVLPVSFSGPVAAAVTVPFLAIFLRDWLVVRGSLLPGSRRYKTLHGGANWALQGGVLPALRVALVVMVVLRAVRGETGALSIALAEAVLLGVAGRLAATLLLIVTGLGVAGGGLSASLDGVTVALAAAGGVLMALGVGRPTILAPEKAFLGRRYGGER